jgi:hypothetical protein
MLIQNHIVVFAKKGVVMAPFYFSFFLIIILPISNLVLWQRGTSLEHKWLTGWKKGNIEARPPLIAKHLLKVKF